MKESDSIDDFAGKISGMANKFSELGEPLGDAAQVKKLFGSVPKKFLQVVASLEQLIDIDDMLFEEAIGRLKAYEERIRKEDGQGDQLLLTHEEWNALAKKDWEETRRHGRGSPRSWSRGHGCCRRGSGILSSSFKEGSSSGSIDKKHIKSFNCDKLGHYASECWKEKWEEEANLIPDEEPALMLTIAQGKTLKEKKLDVVMLIEEDVFPEFHDAEKSSTYTDV